jgi:hypothetical protein
MATPNAEKTEPDMSTTTADLLNSLPQAAASEDTQAPLPHEIIEDARQGAARLFQMQPQELQTLIARRVRMLETELNEREERRTAIEEAMAAQRILGVRRQRARRIRRKVNIGSSLVAATFAGFIVVSLLTY